MAIDDGAMVSTHSSDWTYRNASSTALDLLGYASEDLIGDWAYAHVHPDDATRFILALRYAREASPFTIAYRARRRDGMHVWVESTIELREGSDDLDEDLFVAHTRRVDQGEAMARQSDHSGRLELVERVLVGEDLRIVFQPVVELDSGRVIAYEALSRFPGDPARTPDRWFDDAWALGLGIPLELLAVRKAVEGLDQLPPEIKVCVNASPPTVASRGFLEALGGSANRITVELTEHQEISDYDAFSQAVAPLRSAGGKLAIDDFGAGFASLKHILSVKPDLIKLDISLTERIGESPVAHALTTALLSFAGEIGIDVIAEGIETDDELDTLTEIGVRFGQGFHIGMPAPLDEALEASSN